MREREYRNAIFLFLVECVPKRLRMSMVFEQPRTLRESLSELKNCEYVVVKIMNNSFHLVQSIASIVTQVYPVNPINRHE